MKSKYICIVILATSLSFFTDACKKFVQIGPPNTQIVTASVFNNSNAVTAALLNIYIGMVSNAESWSISQNQGLLADELTTYSTDLGQLQFYTNSMTATNITEGGDWVTAYNYIYQANALIAGLENNESISSSINNQITGEALFIRAFWHFYLTNMYGSIPLVTTTAYNVNESIGRTSRTLVYSQVIKDLQQAKGLLNANYVDATDTAITSDRIRPNKSAAAALLARVFLYAGQYDSAESESTDVINITTLYHLCTNLSGPNSVFLMNSTEAIWQLGVPDPPPFASNTPDANNFILIAAPGTSIANSCVISPELLNAFEPGDQRMVNWVGAYTVSNPTINYYFPYKYQSYNTTTITEYTMVLRLAEQYLIRAEAEANLGDMADATTDLNIIRARAGLGTSPTLTGSASLQQADSAILHERQVELFTEWGHRWFDLNRIDSINSVMSLPGNISQSKGGSWNVDWQLYPIPQSEIMADVNLTQNPGY